MMFNVTRMEAMGWETHWRSELREFVREQPREWVPKLNDQDIFNAVLSRNPSWATHIPCEWNLQYHAFMNSHRLCSEQLNCDASLEKGIFVCPRKPSLVHFMGQSYKATDRSYYTTFWESMASFPLSLLRESLLSLERRQGGSSRAGVEV
uniref:Uncharacterized protein n=2 Tax=Octactis speculum TaxID=3111310 RepID=A0A7S2DKV1_9STRA